MFGDGVGVRCLGVRWNFCLYCIFSLLLLSNLMRNHNGGVSNSRKSLCISVEKEESLRMTFHIHTVGRWKAFCLMSCFGKYANGIMPGSLMLNSCNDGTIAMLCDQHPSYVEGE